MRAFAILAVVLVWWGASSVFAQSPFDGRTWGVVLSVAGTNDIRVQTDVIYSKLADRYMHMDVYFPKGLGANDLRATIVILNGLGDQLGQATLKSSPSHVSWARLLAANGFIVVTAETEVNRIQESFEALFSYLATNATKYHIDPDHMGIQAFSANCREAITFAMGGKAFSGIKAATFYYGEAPSGLFREDLPVLFVIAELDIRGNNYSNLWREVLRNNAPWTITVAKDMPHAFDCFSDTETSRRTILSTISFWKSQLSELPANTLPFSKEREIVASRYDRDQARFLQLMRTWVEEHPDTRDAYALFLFATALMENQEFAEAERYLRKGSMYEKVDYLTLATVLYAQGKTSEGDTALNVYLSQNASEGFTFWFIANRLIAAEKYSEAASLYERALKYPDHGPWLYYNLGVSYAKIGDLAKAFKYLVMAAEKGYGVKSDYADDERLVSLRNDARWQDLLALVK